MPIDTPTPSARDEATAITLSPCIATPRCPVKTDPGEHRCWDCHRADRIALALATARAEEREACATVCAAARDSYMAAAAETGSDDACFRSEGAAYCAALITRRAEEESGRG